jgi:hypothetical protein
MHRRPATGALHVIVDVMALLVALAIPAQNHRPHIGGGDGVDYRLEVKIQV